MSADPTDRIAVDTSVAIPLSVATHPDHDEVSQWATGRRLVLSGHAAVESYSVLTRLPNDLTVDGKTAASMLANNFGEPIVLPENIAQRIPEILADAGVLGGAAYDGLVALAALHHDLPLATRDRRARPTYAALGVHVITVI